MRRWLNENDAFRRLRTCCGSRRGVRTGNRIASGTRRSCSSKRNFRRPKRNFRRPKGRTKRLSKPGRTRRRQSRSRARRPKPSPCRQRPKSRRRPPSRRSQRPRLQARKLQKRLRPPQRRLRARPGQTDRQAAHDSPKTQADGLTLGFEPPGRGSRTPDRHPGSEEFLALTSAGRQVRRDHRVRRVSTEFQAIAACLGAHHPECG